METVETIDYKGHEINIVNDLHAGSPRGWDNLGTMICFHKRYSLGDDNHDYNYEDYSSWDELKRAILKKEDIAVILPIYMYDHSGITIATTPFACRWDSGQIGFIFVSKEKVREEYGVKRITKQILKRVSDYLISEVATYDEYIQGDVYGFVIDEDGDSCYGFYGYDHETSGLLNEAKASIDYLERCSVCQRRKKNFIHLCQNSSMVTEIYGCPEHDDTCPFC